jgi:ceramide glucosyltransferase
MNTEFIGGVLVARMLEGMKFAVGPTIAARRQAIEAIGGFDRLKEYLAEDFVMGKFAADAGWTVILSSYVIEHRIGSETFATNAAHRLRWARSTRRSRPGGYVGQLFTNPLPLALLLVLVKAEWWPVLAVTLVIRAVAAYATAGFILKDSQAAGRWVLILVQDLLSFAFWIAGFFGNTIVWRGRKYYLQTDGRFVLVG